MPRALIEIVKGVAITRPSSFPSCFLKITPVPSRPGEARPRRVEPLTVLQGPRRSAAAQPNPESREDQLVAELLPLVKKIAMKIRQCLPVHVETDDLVGAGSLGLLDAVRKFDTRKQVKIGSYARHRIRGAMLDELRSLDTASRDMRKKSKKVEKVYRELESRLGQGVGDAEVASALGVSMNEWYRMVREFQAAGLSWLRAVRPSRSTPQSGAEEGPVAENQTDPFERCYRLEQREILKCAIAGLPKRQREVISLYYQQPQTMKQIAGKLGLDQSRVSQLHSAALIRLRRRVNTILRGSVPGFALGLDAPERGNSLTAL